MRLAPGHPRCLLVVAPHPDDETIGAHTLIARLRRRGVAVRVLVVTDGRASHPGSLRWPRERLVAERRRETRRAMRALGVPADAVAFLSLPDGDLGRHADEARRRIGQALRRAPRPILVAAPAISDDHPDHRVVSDAVAVTRLPGIRRLAYPVWPAGRALPGARALRLSAQERLAKRQAIRGYRTQTGRITDDPAGFALTRAQIESFSRPVEMFVEMA